MSHTSVYAVFKTTTNVLAELHNGYGSGPAIWDYISLKLTGKKLSLSDDLDWFWPLWKDPKLDNDERACLLLTYDLAIVETNHLVEFAAACEKVHEKIISQTPWTWNHFAAIGIEAAKLADHHDYRTIGLGLGCTSVSDPWEYDFDYKQCFGVYGEIDTLSV